MCVCVKRGIVPELASDEHTTCSIGKDKRGKWWGWSHRAMYGFTKGSRVKEGDIIKSLPPGFVANDEADARAMAVAFASEVS